MSSLPQTEDHQCPHTVWPHSVWYLLAEASVLWQKDGKWKTSRRNLTSLLQAGTETPLSSVVKVQKNHDFYLLSDDRESVLRKGKVTKWPSGPELAKKKRRLNATEDCSAWESEHRPGRKESALGGARRTRERLNMTGAAAESDISKRSGLQGSRRGTGSQQTPTTWPDRGDERGEGGVDLWYQSQNSQRTLTDRENSPNF